MYRPFFALVPLLVLAACASSEGDDSATDSQNVTAATSGKSVAGYDFDGPKALPSDNAPSVCPPILSPGDVVNACFKVKGKQRLANFEPPNNCAVLCSKPIAPENKIAGYDFEGFKFQSTEGPPVLCAAVVSPEEEACNQAGGTPTTARCKTLCSIPIAKAGKVAGFNAKGFTTADAAGDEICPAVLDPDAERCFAVEGQTSRAAGCTTLCSLPF